jgi:hypothetical protein
MDFRYSNGTTEVVPFPILLRPVRLRDNREWEMAHPSC